MAIRDYSQKKMIQDKDENIFIGIDLPFRKSDGVEGWFASSSTTLQSVKNDIKSFLNTNVGERVYHPTLGINLRKYLFQPIDNNTMGNIEGEIVDKVGTWFPFITINNLVVNQSQEDEHKIKISLTFRINNNPTMLESITVEI
tara:strand:+ start:1733 stop:2161 length:429 start_codon:yes stop_codon:yes gene_type:complete